MTDDSERDTVFVPAGEMSVGSMSLENFEGTDPFLGTQIDGKYEVLENVGQGGMSIVYKAMQTAMHRIVALKMLKMGLSSDPVFSQRFMREVSLLGKLNHTNIVTVFDSGKTAQGHLYLVMDFLSGPTLQDVLDKSGALPIERAAPLILQICDALNHAHKRDIIHRDLKPGNIMIETDHRGGEIVKIVDFGLAKMGEGSERLTRAGELWGSSFYMSPEQCNGAESDARTDIYSFGIVVYQLITGKVPFRGSGFMETVTKQMNEPPPPLKATKADLVLPDMLERVLFKCLEKAPENRFQNVADLKSALQSALPEAPKPEKEASRPTRPSKPAPPKKPVQETKKSSSDRKSSSLGKGLLVLGIVLILCVIAVLVVLSHKSAEAPDAVAPENPARSKESIGVHSRNEKLAAPVQQTPEPTQSSAADASKAPTASGRQSNNSNPDTKSASSAGEKKAPPKNKARKRTQEFFEIAPGSGTHKRDALDYVAP